MEKNSNTSQTLLVVISALKIADVNTVFGFFPKRKIDCSLERLISLIEKYRISRVLRSRSNLPSMIMWRGMRRL